MEIKLAKTAGFCFGVNRAVKMVYSLLDEGKKVATLGPIIHNTEMVNELKSRGVVTVASPADTQMAQLLLSVHTEFPGE